MQCVIKNTPDSLGAAAHKRVRVDVTTYSRKGRGAQSPRPCCARALRLQASGFRTNEKQAKQPEGMASPEFVLAIQQCSIPCCFPDTVVQFGSSLRQRCPHFLVEVAVTDGDI